MDKTGRLNYIEMGIDDMTNLVELSDESLLYNLQTRYNSKIIYTYIGSILISINPYTELNIYDKKNILRYQNKSMQEAPPHLFGIAEINYSKMMMENENQVIVISGESGAGKTESFKRILRYLAHTSGGVKDGKSSNRDNSNDIANKILDSTPLLESFGNAKTIRNDNSSRFGKYVEIFFENGEICGSRTTNYLLEKSRIVNISSEERGYHIFYELLQGLDSYGKSQYHFKNVSDYVYLNKAKNFSVKGRDDGANLKEFMGQWSTLGLTNDDLDVVMRIVSAVLHLGNIQFKEEEDASFMVETENVNIVAKMLKVDCKSLISCLTMKTTDTVKDIASSPVNAEQAANLRDTLAKHLYSELFDWIVSKVNESLNQKTATLKRTPSHLDRSMNSSTSKLRCIAMLDIYGFENFPENSLEQLCINYANETLQQFFNRYVFELEQAEYKQEGISWHYVTYPDNQPIIDILSAKPSGIIQILNDECSIPQGTDGAFLAKCHNVHQKNANFEKPKKIDPPQFIIRHFAGNIYYNVNGFLEKNRDIIRKEALLLVEHCGVDEIASMFKKKKEKSTKNPNLKARTPAVMADFQNSLATLLVKMKTCQPWFIRCLKPNNNKQALTFVKDIVMDQMRYTGILETVKIRKSGFPIRIVFSLFLSRFYLLLSKEMRRFSKKDPQEACLKMLPSFRGQKGKDFEVGRTKLFLKEHFARHLESQVRVIRERSAIKIQRIWRAYWKIREIIVKNRAATKLQAVIRGFLDRRRIKRLHTAIVKLQAFVRMQLVRRAFIERHPEFLKYSVIKIQSNSISKSTATAYKYPEFDVSFNQKKNRKQGVSSKFNYNLLKIPMKLAFLLEKATENYGSGHEIPSPGGIMQTCRAQHLYNRDKYQLPNDINDYIIDEFLEQHGQKMSLDSKIRPISVPFLTESASSTFKDDSLNAHKLVLRLIYADSMPWFHRYLTGSFLSYMASTSPQLQMEILIQVIAETIFTKNDTNVSRKKFMINEIDSKRLAAGWTILGNLLSHIVPVPDIFNYVLKYVSDSIGIDQACTCQEKLLQFVSDQSLKVPRLFPASNLEWRANGRGSKTSLKVYHADDATNSVRINSFSTAESFANHSICFRLKRFRINKGWSISIVAGDTVIDCSGHSYVFDVISGLELTSHWADIVGYGIEHKFLTSRNYNNENKMSSEYTASNMYKPTSKYPVESLNKSIATITSRKSMDSWVDKYFDKSIKLEEGIHDYIHGLEDDILRSQVNNQYNPHTFPVVNQSMIGTSQIGIPRINVQQPAFQYVPMPYAAPAPSSYYFSANSDRRYLEEKLDTVVLENKVIQSSIDNELLQKRLQELRAESTPHIPQHVPYQPYAYQMPQPYTPYIYPMQVNPSMVPGQYMPQGNIQIPYMTHQFMPNEMPSSNGTTNHSTDSINTVPNIVKVTKSVQTKRMAPGPPGESLRSDAINGAVTEDSNEHRNVESKVTFNDGVTPPKVTIRRHQRKDNENLTESEKRAADVPKVDFSDRAAFLDKFFQQKPNNGHQSTKIKRPAPIIPANPSSSPPSPALPKYDGYVPAPPPLIPQPKLIPRPSIFSEIYLLKPKKTKETRDDTIKETEIKEILTKLDDSFKSADPNEKVEPPQIKKRRKRGQSSGKTAMILSGLPDIRYYTYTNQPWFPLVKIELFLPKEIQDTTLFNRVIFCQIVRDLIEYPCIRWIGDERRDILKLLGNIKALTNIKTLLSTPSSVIRNVIDRAQKCELYFSRFYSIQWLSTNASGNVCHWLTISHSGIRFVEQNLKIKESALVVIDYLPYSDLSTVNNDKPDIYGNPQRLTIKTNRSKIYQMITTHAQSAKNLISEFMGDTVEVNNMKSISKNGFLTNEFKQNRPNKRKPLDEHQFTGRLSSDPMTLGVNNQRIPINLVSSTVDQKSARSRPSGDLIDFILSRSNLRTRQELEKNVMKWNRHMIAEPLLSNINDKLSRKSLELYKFILDISEDGKFHSNSSATESGVSIFEIICHNKELVEEIVIQIMKQINGNPNQQNRLRLWSLLSTLIIFFGVTKHMEPYLLVHLNQMMKVQFNPDLEFVYHTLKTLQTTMTYGPRKEWPLDEELKHLLNGIKGNKTTIYLPRDAVELSVAFNNTVGEIVKNICRSLEVNETHEIAEYNIGLVEVNDTNVPVRLVECLRSECYLFDYINSLAKEKKCNFIFYFSRCSWISPLMPTQRSEQLITLLFNQMTQDMITGNWMDGDFTDKTFIDLIFSIAFFNLHGQGIEKPIPEELLEAILPSKMLLEIKKPKPDLVKMIYATPNTENITEMKKSVDYQRKFIELVIQLPRFGWISFPISGDSYVRSSKNDYINFTPNHISISNEDTSEEIVKISLASFVSFSFSKINAKTTQFDIRHDGANEIRFFAEKISEKVFLLNHYLNMRTLVPTRRL